MSEIMKWGKVVISNTPKQEIVITEFTFSGNYTDNLEKEILNWAIDKLTKALKELEEKINE